MSLITIKLRQSIGLFFGGWILISPATGIPQPDPDHWLAVGSFSGNGSSCLSANWTVTRVKGILPGNWVPAWKGFAVQTDEGIGSLSVDGTLIKRSKTQLDVAARPRQWSVSADGKILGEFDHTDPGKPVLQVRNLDTGKVLKRLGNTALENALGKARATATGDEGVSFSPSGRYLAFRNGFGAPLDNGGEPDLRTGILDLKTGRLHNLGHGSPVAWLDDSHVLVQTYSGTAILDLRGRVVAKRESEIEGQETVGQSWDGKAVMWFRDTPVSGTDIWNKRGLTLERWTPDLRRRISARLYPDLGWVDVNSGVFAAPR